MAPIKAQSFLVHNLLVVLATSFVFLGFIFLQEKITFWPNIWGYLEQDEKQIPILLGIVPFFHCSIFLGYLFLYLIFEFYGCKSSFYALLGICLNCALVFFFFEGLRLLALHFQKDPFINTTVLSFFAYPKRLFLSHLAAFLLGETVGLVFGHGIRFVTRNYFMFLRFPISSCFGFTVFVAAQIYIQNFETLSIQDMLVFGIEPAAQFFVGILAAVIPLYFLRLGFGLFKGWAKKEKNIKIKNASDPEKTERHNEEEVTVSSSA